jgi:chemotaxis protein CheZ
MINSEPMQQQTLLNPQVQDVPAQDDMLNRIGHVTRTLHDSLRGLGLDKIMDQVAHDIPDARDRLKYVAKMTEQAAERVLNATDAAMPLQDNILSQAGVLEERWKTIMASASVKSEYNEIANETLAYLATTSKNSTDTKALLMDIMMAQDFQDLTGQVIKKITSLAQDLERQLVQVLVDFSPNSPVNTKKEPEVQLMNGPQIDPENTVDVVASQEQVDDLLDSLGF